MKVSYLYLYFVDQFTNYSNLQVHQSECKILTSTPIYQHSTVTTYDSFYNNILKNNSKNCQNKYI